MDETDLLTDHKLEISGNNMEDLTLYCDHRYGPKGCRYEVDLPNPVTITQLKELEEAHIKEITNA